MEIKPKEPKEILEERFCSRSISIINNILRERFKIDKSVKITFEEFCRRWDDYNHDYEEEINHDFYNIGDLFGFYGWTVIDSDFEGKIFSPKIES